MLRSLTNVFYPARFQGARKRRAYFEGYYVKVVDAASELAVAFIPGVSYDAAGEGHAFVQVLDGVAGTAAYHRFEPSALDYAATDFSLDVGPHRFSSRGMQVDLPGARATLSFRQNTPWPSRWYSPGAMGPFTFVPGMECRHGVVSLHHGVSGTLDGRTLSPGAVGYIEKDWGRSFPRNWVWLQSSHLDGETEPCCLMVSAGRVPFAGASFTGFIAALLWRGRFLPFTTYNGASLKLELRDEAAHLRFSRKGLTLKLVAHHAPGIDLVAPDQGGGMVGRVNESLRAHADVTLTEGGREVLSTTARWMGFEVGGAW